MKICLLSVFFSSLCFASQDDALVLFSNGDKLSGNLVSIHPETLILESELLDAQAQFKLDHVLDLRWSSKLNHQVADQASHEATLELTNGDLVKGLLTEINDQEIHLKTWYAGNMVFRRLNVAAIKVARVSKILYRGPNDTKDWKTAGNEGAWKIENNEILSQSFGSIGRNVDFTDNVEVEYHVNFKGLLKYKVILFGSDITTSSPETGYEFSFREGEIEVKRLGKDEDGEVWLDRIVNAYPKFSQDEKVKFEIHVSKSSKKIAILINDTLAGIWLDTGIGKINGKGLMFVSNTSYKFGISNLVVSEWDEIIDGVHINDFSVQKPRFAIGFNREFREPKETESNELPAGRMMLANGDTIDGEILGIKDELINMRTPFTDVSFPLNRITNINLQNSSLETAKREKHDIRVVLADGSKLVFRLDECRDGRLHGYSQNFGHAVFLQSAFKSIQFNIYRKGSQSIAK